MSDDDKQKKKDDGGSPLDCNICWDVAKKPVITLCGHMYCWPCLHQWLESNQTTCPVCRAGVTRENVVPFFGRGSSSREDPRDDPTIPERPTRPREEPRPRRRAMPAFSDIFHTDFTTGGNTNGGLTFFPGLFGFQMNFGDGAGANNQPAGRNEPYDPARDLLSRAFLLLGAALLICILFM
ncbi:RING-type E3 ubiquitin transferase [Plasmodiophora brassicae]|uniref:RING-type E3 ubiquitin transferase n=1 Tax=Plasmodiophora brassicae TaxID=37360 RepID=A0A0G4IX59_PLABS|nr:hypothetical protein PBRA_007654 [Plasmodiophora brassicae]SPQ99552.1 unnamed protein product [Plasmodiophora brassicae]